MLTESTLMRPATPGLTFACICNHPDNAHSLTGHCRVPGCPCEQYQPMPEVGGGHRRLPSG